MSTLGPTQCKEVSEKLLDKCMIAYINECVDEEGTGTNQMDTVLNHDN